jgi:hypothetical protein
MEKKSLMPTFPMPMRGLLLLTGMYTFAWSAFFRYFGEDLMRWLSMSAMQNNFDPGIAMGLTGMAIGFLIFVSAFYPISWNILILIGAIGKTILAIWFVSVYIPELSWNKRTIFHLVFNELLWLLPLLLVYFRTIKVKNYLKYLN